jgi:hypothetical protein
MNTLEGQRAIEQRAPVFCMPPPQIFNQYLKRVRLAGIGFQQIVSDLKQQLPERLLFVDRVHDRHSVGFCRGLLWIKHGRTANHNRPASGVLMETDFQHRHERRVEQEGRTVG